MILGQSKVDTFIKKPSSLAMSAFPLIVTAN